MGKLPFINDKWMAEILLELVKSGQSFNGLNKIIYDKDLPFFIRGYWKNGQIGIYYYVWWKILIFICNQINYRSFTH